MKDLNEVFNNSLREYQKPVFEEVLRHDKVLLKAPMDFGKTYLSCVYADYLLNSGKIKSVTFAIQNYQMRNKIISDLQKIGLTDKLIVCLEGKERSFMPAKGKQTRIGTILKEIHNLKGIVDVDFIRKKWPKANPYKVLMALQDYADIIIVHHSMLNTNKKIRKTDFLIVDDADLMNRDKVFTIAKYKVFQGHLQAIEDLTEGKEFKEKINRHKDTLPLLNAMMDTLYHYIPENPVEIETNLVAEAEERRIDSQYLPILTKNKSPEEVDEWIERTKRLRPRLGIMQASNPVKLSSLLDDFKIAIKIYTDGLVDQISNEVSYAVSLHLHYLLEVFFNALLNPTFNVKQSQIDKDWSTLEINMTNASDFMDVVNRYSKVLWISATADPQDLEGFSLIESKYDPNSDHKSMLIISKEKIPEVLSKFRNRNVFVITNSKRGAEEFRNQYGGEILTSETYESITKNAKNSRGILTVGYVNGIGSRGLDDLAQLYEAVLVYSWIYRSVVQKDGQFYNDQFVSQNLKDVSQFIGRIMRGSSEHVLILIEDESETGSKLQQYITQENPDWKQSDDLDEVIAKIPERTVKEKGKIRFHKEKRILKDGSVETIYRVKTSEEVHNKLPDSLEMDI